jgi:hypothetical protein
MLGIVRLDVSNHGIPQLEGVARAWQTTGTDGREDYGNVKLPTPQTGPEKARRGYVD